MERLDVTIFGKDYALACEPAERDSLVMAAHMVDRAMQRIKSGGKIAAAERIAVMAALQLASELVNAQPAENSAPGSADYQRKLENIHRMIDEALGTQEKLF